MIVVLTSDMYSKGFGELECSWAPPCSSVETETAHPGRCALDFGQGRDSRWLRLRAISCVRQLWPKRVEVAAVAR